MMVMISTVGYGDIYPHTSGGRATVSLVILVAMVFVPRETNELLEMIMQSSKYQRAWYVPPKSCLLYTSPSPRDLSTSRMPSSA